MTDTAQISARDDRAAIDKAFCLLVAFGDQARTGIGVSELARRAKLSKSTAFRVLGMLERNAMVEKVGTHYRLGPRLHELGSAAVHAPGHEQLRDRLLPFLTDLFQVSGHTVHLAALHGHEVLYLSKLYGHRTVAAPSRIGRTLPAHCTGVGKVLLAYDLHAGSKVLDVQDLVALTPHSLTDSASLEAELAMIRRDGVAWDREESRVGVHCIAAPVFTRPGVPCAAMSVSAPIGTDMRPLALALRRVCASATQAMSRGPAPQHGSQASGTRLFASA